MKTITFLRHAQLEPSFTNYEALSFPVFSDLATGAKDPHINQPNEKDSKEVVDNLPHGISQILHSTLTRSKETAELIAKDLPSVTSLVSESMLNEIYFNPVKMMTEDEFKTAGLSLVRPRLYELMMQNSDAVENIEHVLQRISHLEKFFLHSPAPSILCITHSFFMRVLVHYFLKNKKKASDYSAQDLIETIDYPYLQGFSIEL